MRCDATCCSKNSRACWEYISLSRRNYEFLKDFTWLHMPKVSDLCKMWTALSVFQSNWSCITVSCATVGWTRLFVRFTAVRRTSADVQYSLIFPTAGHSFDDIQVPQTVSIAAYLIFQGRAGSSESPGKLPAVARRGEDGRSPRRFSQISHNQATKGWSSETAWGRKKMYS